jgi:uncharacterized protein
MYRLVLKVLIFVLVPGVLAYIILCAYLADKLTLAVRTPLVSTPADYGLVYEPVQFNSLVDGVPLQGWLIGTGGSSQDFRPAVPAAGGREASAGSQTILMLHAKDGKRDDPTIGLLDIARALVQHSYNVFVFDFRGHGESGGTRVGFASLEVRDVGGALAYLKTRGISQVGALGFSMGAATALNSAPEYPAMRVVVADSSFSDLQQLLDVEVPKASGLPAFFTPGIVFMSWPLFGMDLANDKPARAIARLGSRPVLLIHGTADAYVPVGHAYALQQAGAADPNLRLWIVPGAEHVRAYKQFPDEYLKRVIGFFDEFMR